MRTNDELQPDLSSPSDGVVDFLFFRKFVSRVQGIYRGFLMGGVVACGILVGSVFYSVHVTNQATKEHQAALEALKSEYAATSKVLKDEVDHLSSSLIEKYREALKKLSGAYDARLQVLEQTHQVEIEELKKGHQKELHSLLSKHEREIKEVEEQWDSRVKALEKELEIATAKQHAAETREMAIRRAK